MSTYVVGFCDVVKGICSLTSGDECNAAHAATELRRAIFSCSLIGVMGAVESVPGRKAQRITKDKNVQQKSTKLTKEEKVQFLEQVGQL